MAKQGDLFSDLTPQREPEPRKSYTADEIMRSSVEYFHGDELAANVWMNKYALREDNRIYELNPDMMHRRLAAEYALVPSHLSLGLGFSYAGFRADVSFLTLSPYLGNTFSFGIGYSF